MNIEVLPQEFTVCKVRDLSSIDKNGDFLFVGKTDQELSVVCESGHVPKEMTEREDGFRAFRIGQVLEFSLIGILAGISSVLAEHQIGIFVVSTYETDYILVKKGCLDEALILLAEAGYTILEEAKVPCPLSLEGAVNVRELGGYRNQKGRILRKHQFLRADSLHRLTKEDQGRLLDYGVAAVIDLRSSMESQQNPCVFRKLEKVDYYSVPLLDQINSSGFKGAFPKSMSELYIGLLENNKAEFLQIFRIMSQYPDQCVVFHCTAGKDRTGVTAMLLLHLAGMDRETIAKDYAVSEKYLGKVFIHQKEQMHLFKVEIPTYVLASDPEELKKTLDFLEGTYKSAENYLLLLGLSKNEIRILKEKLLGFGGINF